MAFIAFYFKNAGYVETIALYEIYPLRHHKVIFSNMQGVEQTPPSQLQLFIVPQRNVTHSVTPCFPPIRPWQPLSCYSVYLPNLDISYEWNRWHFVSGFFH